MLGTASALSFVAFVGGYVWWIVAVEDDRTGTNADTIISGALSWLGALGLLACLITALVRWRRRRRG